MSGRRGRGGRFVSPPPPPRRDIEDLRLGIHRTDEEQAAHDAATRRYRTLQRLCGQAASEADWQASLRQFADHLTAAGFRLDRAAGHDAWRIFDGELELSRERVVETKPKMI